MDNTSQNQQAKRITIPYVQGVAEKIGRLLRREGVQTAFKPVHTLNQVFPRPKDRQTDPLAKREIVYKIPCLDCNFVYYGQTKRSLKKRVGEHKDAVKNQDPNSKIAQHVKETKHAIGFIHAVAVTQAKNFKQRLFLEAWHSIKDENSNNEHINIPNIII